MKGLSDWIVMCLKMLIFLFYATATMDTKAEEDKARRMIELMKEIDKLNNDFPMKIRLDFVDVHLKSLKGVSADIIKTKQNIAAFVLRVGDNKTLRTRIVVKDSYLHFDLTGFSSIRFTFNKKGYYPVEEKFNKSSIIEKAIDNVPESYKKSGQAIKWLKNACSKNGYLVKKTVILRKIPPLPKCELEFGEICLLYKKEADAPAIRKGWRYKKDEYGEIKESVAFDEISDVDLYVSRDTKDKTKLYLVSNNDKIGFIVQPRAKDMTYLTMAPKEGYQQKVLLEYNLHDYNKNAFFAYWKINGKLYGKMKIEVTLIDRSLEEDYQKEDGSYVMYSLDITYFINPSGSRNVATTYEDDY